MGENEILETLFLFSFHIFTKNHKNTTPFSLFLFSKLLSFLYKHLKMRNKIKNYMTMTFLKLFVSSRNGKHKLFCNYVINVHTQFSIIYMGLLWYLVLMQSTSFSMPLGTTKNSGSLVCLKQNRLYHRLCSIPIPLSNILVNTIT